MDIVVYAKYFDEDDSVFDLNNDFFKDDDDYFKMLEKECNREDVMTDCKSMCSVIDDDSIEKSEYNGKYTYAKCPGKLFYNGKEEDIDGFFDKWAQQISSTFNFELDIDNADEEFFEWINSWFEFNEKERKVGDKMSKLNAVNDFELIRKMDAFNTYRDFYISLVNKANETKYFELKNCKLLKKNNICSYTISVGEISLLDDEFVSLQGLNDEKF